MVWYPCVCTILCKHGGSPRIESRRAKQYLANGNAVYLGLYATYDLEGSDSEKSELVEYNSSGSAEPLRINSVLGSGSDGDAFKLRMFSVGLRLKYAFNF